MTEKPPHEELDKKVKDVEKQDFDLKQTEGALRQNEGIYRDLANLSPDPVVISQDGRLKLANSAFMNLFGCTQQDIDNGLDIFDFIEEQDKEIVRKRYEDRINRRYVPKRLVIDLIARDGRTIPCETSSEFIQFNGRPAIFVIVRDITQYKQTEEKLRKARDELEKIVEENTATIINQSEQLDRGINERKVVEKALRESEERYRLLFENAGALIQVYDNNGVCQMINGIAAGYYEGAPEDFVGKSIHDLQLVESDEYLRRVQNIVTSGEGKVFDELVKLPSGKERWMLSNAQPVRDASGRVFAVQIISQDVTEHRKMEEALLESEEKFRALVETTLDWVWEMDQNGIFTYINPNIKKILGYDSEEVIGRPFTDFLPADEAVRAYEIFKKYSESKKPALALEITNIHKLGHNVVVEVNGVPILDQIGNLSGWRGVSRDITERKQTEEALRESKERWRSLTANSSDFIMTLNLDANILFVNRTFPEFTKDQVIGKSVYDFTPEQDKAAMEECFDRVLQTGEPERLETTYRHIDGSIRSFESYVGPLLKDGGVIGITMSSRDLTWRRQWEEEIENEKERFRVLVEGSPFGVSLIGKHDRFKYVNPMFTNMFGYALEDIPTNQEWLRKAFPSPGYRKQVLRSQELDQNVSKPGEVRTNTFTVTCKDGKEKVTHLRTVTMVTGEKVVFYEDVTEQKRLEAQLFQAQKMEALGTLVAGVAHEINNPINLVMFNVPLLKKIWKDFLAVLEEQSEKEPEKKYGGLDYDFLKENLDKLLSDMELAANRVERIVKGLKDFAKQSDVAEKGPIQINEAVKNAIQLIQTTLRKSGIDSLVLDLQEDMPPMDGHLQSIEQVILNLLINAIDSIEHKRGMIKITTGVKKDVGKLYIFISDNGRGINPSISNRIFDPFVTDKQAEGGTGLGLSVSYNLVKAHGGDITFSSELGKGTTFQVTFPIKVKEMRTKILVADDDESFRRMLIRALAKNPSYSMDEAANGTEALIKLGAYRPDLLILDIFMPEMDGVEVCRAIKDEPELSETKVIIITGFPGNQKLEEISRIGYTDIYTKPLSLKDFVKEVGNILEYEIYT